MNITFSFAISDYTGIAIVAAVVATALVTAYYKTRS